MQNVNQQQQRGPSVADLYAIIGTKEVALVEAQGQLIQATQRIKQLQDELEELKKANEDKKLDGESDKAPAS